MKILITGTAGFIGFSLAEKLAKRGDEVVGLDSINDYYDQNVKYGRLKHSGIINNLENGKNIQYNKLIKSTKFNNYNFIKLDLTDRENVDKLFKEQEFDAVCNLVAQAGVRYSLTNKIIT